MLLDVYDVFIILERDSLGVTILMLYVLNTLNES